MTLYRLKNPLTQSDEDDAGGRAPVHSSPSPHVCTWWGKRGYFMGESSLEMLYFTLEWFFKQKEWSEQIHFTALMAIQLAKLR